MMSKHLAAVLISNTELHLVLVALEHTSNCSWLSLAQLGNYSCSSQNIIGDCMLIVHKPLQTCIIWCMIVQPQKIKSCKWFYISETFRQKWCCSRKHLQAIVSPLLLYTTIWYVGLQPLYATLAGYLPHAGYSLAQFYEESPNSILNVVKQTNPRALGEVCFSAPEGTPRPTSQS